MEREKLFDIVKEIAVEVLGVDAAVVTEKASFKSDLGADSLDLVELVMALEERFDITIPEDDLEGITTIGEALDYVAKAESVTA